jgi:hypothetical protein
MQPRRCFRQTIPTSTNASLSKPTVNQSINNSGKGDLTVPNNSVSMTMFVHLAPIYSGPKVSYLFFFLGVGWEWVHLVRRPIFGLLYQPRIIDDECGVVGGMKIGRGNRSTRRKPTPVSLCPPQIPHDLTWDRTRAAAEGSRRLTAWAMARPS